MLMTKKKVSKRLVRKKKAHKTHKKLRHTKNKGRGPSNKSKASKVRKLIRLAKKK